MKNIIVVLLLAGPLIVFTQPNITQIWQVLEPTGVPGGGGPESQQLLVDVDHNIFLATYQDIFTPFSGYALIKYDSLGEKKWLQTYPSQYHTLPRGYVMDQAGDIYIALVRSFGAGGTPNATILKYNAYSTLLWEQEVGENNNFYWENEVVHLAPDTLGYLYATGRVYDLSAPQSEYRWGFVACYHAEYGIELWHNDLYFLGQTYPLAFRLLPDRIEAAWLTGGYVVATQLDYDGDLIQVDSILYLPATPLIRGNIISDDGSVTLGIADFAYRAIKVNLQGDTVWHYNLSPINTDQSLRVRAMAEDDSNNVYLTGTFNYPATGVDALTTKLDASGSVVWQHAYAYQGGQTTEEGSHLVVDDRYVYVVGYSTTNALILLYDKNTGESLAELRIPQGATNAARDIKLLPDGFVVSAVSNAAPGYPDSGSVVLYRFRLLQESSNTTVVATPAAQLEIYPNPAGDYCFVTQTPDRPFEYVSCTDLNGREVRKQYFRHIIEQFDLTGLPSGIYVLTASGRNAAVSKLIIVR